MRRARVVEREQAREGTVAVAAGTHRVRRLRQVVAQPPGEMSRERLKRARPANLRRQCFRVQLEQPSPAVGALECASGRAAKVGELLLERLRA